MYHPLNEVMVVEEDEAASMRASGVWFDSPADARKYLEQVEDSIKNEPKSRKTKKEKQDER